MDKLKHLKCFGRNMATTHEKIHAQVDELLIKNNFIFSPEALGFT